MSINNSVTRLVKYNQSIVIENANLKQRLVDALSNDAADAATIATAKADAEAANVNAEAANAKVAELQKLADEDVKEDAELQAMIESVLPAEESTTPVEETPAPIEETPAT